MAKQNKEAATKEAGKVVSGSKTTTKEQVKKEEELKKEAEVKKEEKKKVGPSKTEELIALILSESREDLSWMVISENVLYLFPDRPTRGAGGWRRMDGMVRAMDLSIADAPLNILEMERSYDIKGVLELLK